MRPDDVLTAIAGDIERIATDSRWAYYDGWQPKGANPDRVAGSARDLIGRDDDDTPIPVKWKRDIGVGDGRSRQAYLDTAWPCTWIDRALVQALVALGDPTPPLFAVVSYRTSLAARIRALALSESRLELIAEVWDDGDRHQQKAARKFLADPKIDPPSARSAADQAVRTLSRALSRGSTNGQATAEALCKVCGIRPRGERCGERCETCQSWRTRNRGVDRPRSIDTLELAGPLAAAARRRARGQGWGDG